MKQFLKEVAKMAIAIVLGLIYMWFVLSFKWCFEEMSVAEKIIGVVYAFAVIPMYESIKHALRLR